MYIIIKQPKHNKLYVSSVTPTVHETRFEAEQEARRLAEKHPGDLFYVMQKVSQLSGSVTVHQHNFEG